MRARRLRRLGVGSTTGGSETSTTQITQNGPLDSQKNDIKAVLRNENGEIKDEIQHKQKQLKYDETMVALKDSVLNNNDALPRKFNI